MDETNNLSDFIGKRSITIANALTDQLNGKQFVGADTGLAYRVINHWENEGLIDNPREEGERWRRYSFVEFVWIRMVDQMRDIGLKINSIRKVKELFMVPTDMSDLWTLMASLGEMTRMGDPNLPEEEKEGYNDFFAELIGDMNEDKEERQLSILQLLIANAMVKRCPIIAVIFPDGDSFWIEEHPEFVIPPEWKDRMSYEPHARISITGIIKNFLVGDLAFERIDKLPLLNENEAFLLQVLHSGEYDSIKVNFRNKKMDSLEMIKSQETTKRIVDVLAEAEYQDISIKQHKGRVTRIENTVKYHFPK